MRFLNFGSLNIDYVYQVDHFLQPGETMSSQGLQVNCGGKGLNQSIALARAGAETYHAGLIGPEGRFLRETLERAGVDVSAVREIPGSSGHAIIQVDPAGQNSILLYEGANGRFDEAFIDETLDKFSADDVVVLQNETNCLACMVEQASARGLRLALNAAPANGKLRDLPLEKLTWLLVNEIEGAFLAGTQEPEKITEILTEKYPNTTLVLTLGEGGAIAARGAERIFVPARRVQAVDTTAAGDTFTGYFLRCAAEGAPLQEALETATAASAIAVTRPGAAAAVPTMAEVQQLLRR